MDYGTFWFIFLVVGVPLILLYSLKLPKVRGWLGEVRIKCIIGKDIEGERYLINDFRIRTDEGKTSQIDHIVIRRNGIFVIETKNYSGRIYGKESQLEWTQVLSYGRVKNKMYNPIKQNKTHIYLLSKLLNNQYPMVSAVVFIQGNTNHIKAEGVYTQSGLKYLLKKGEDIYSSEEIIKIYNQLMQVKEYTQVSNWEHIKNIRQMKKSIDKNICPRCNGSLVLRQGAGYSFYGCSNYPKCKFTKKY